MRFKTFQVPPKGRSKYTQYYDSSKGYNGASQIEYGSFDGGGEYNPDNNGDNTQEFKITLIRLIEKATAQQGESNEWTLGQTIKVAIHSPSIDYIPDDIIDPSKYRIVFMTSNRKKGRGKTWRVPMFSKRYDTNTGEVIKDTVPCRIPWEETWRTIKNKSHTVIFDKFRPINNILNLRMDSIKKCFSKGNSKRQRLGVAIFKYNEKTNTWHQCSNRAELLLFLDHNLKITVRIVE